MTIGAWGDSITYGAGDTEGLGWVGRVRRQLFTDDETNVYNRGICGDTTRGLLKRFSVEADSMQPERILFAIGINDSKFPAGKADNKVPLEEFTENLRTLIDQARSYTDNVILIGLTPVDEDTNLSPSRFLNETIRTYNAAIAALARENGLPFISMTDVLDTRTDLMDGLHPNAGGYEKMAQVIMKAMT